MRNSEWEFRQYYSILESTFYYKLNKAGRKPLFHIHRHMMQYRMSKDTFKLFNKIERNFLVIVLISLYLVSAMVSKLLFYVLQIYLLSFCNFPLLGTIS